MNAISTTGTTLPIAPTTADGIDSGVTPAGGGDLLAAMNPAMNAAFAIGRPLDSRGAAAILGTAGAYISGAQATLAKLDDGIAGRERRLAELRHVDPAAATKLEAELELLRRLRDRIELSIERVSETLAGDTEDPEEQAARERRVEERAQDRIDQLEALERRRQLLAPHVDSTIPAAPALVASTYGQLREASAPAPGAAGGSSGAAGGGAGGVSAGGGGAA